MSEAEILPSLPRPRTCTYMVDVLISSTVDKRYTEKQRGLWRMLTYMEVGNGLETRGEGVQYGV